MPQTCIDFSTTDIHLAETMFRDGRLSLANAARLAGLPLSLFIRHISRQKIAVVDLTEMQVERDMATLDAWTRSLTEMGKKRDGDFFR